MTFRYGGFPELGVPFGGGSHNEDYDLLGSLLGSAYFWETTTSDFLKTGAQGPRVPKDRAEL